MANQTDIPITGAGAGDFYVGYLAKAPKPTARFTTLAVTAAVILGVAVAALLASSQEPVDDGVFAFGEVTDYRGVLQLDPIPGIRLLSDFEAPGWVMLVGFGKFGIPEKMRALDGELITFRGTPIHRRGLTMLEVTEPDSVQVLMGDNPQGRVGAKVETLGRVELVGELVDSKCFLGVMRPSTGKVHRACAIRCLSGGAPAALWIRGETPDQQAVVLLANPSGERPAFNVEWAGLPVRATGLLERHVGFAVLRVESLTPY